MKTIQIKKLALNHGRNFFNIPLEISIHKVDARDGKTEFIQLHSKNSKRQSNHSRKNRTDWITQNTSGLRTDRTVKILFRSKRYTFFCKRSKLHSRRNYGNSTKQRIIMTFFENVTGAK
jgi:hypothetical protein